MNTIESNMEIINYIHEATFEKNTPIPQLVFYDE